MREVLVRSRPSPVPPSVETFVTADGLRLNLRRWNAPNAAVARGTVLIVHGLGEHIGRYDDLALSLTARGWNVAGHDQRGHGQSEGPRGGLAHDHNLLADLAGVSDHVRGRGKFLLLGHSLGGLVAARFVAESLSHSAARWSREVDGLVLSSPALDAGLSAAQRALLAVLAPLAPSLRLGNGLKPEWISRNPAVVHSYVNDSLVHPHITPRMVGFIAAAGPAVLQQAAQWRVPTLLMWAGADRCVRPAGSQAFAQAARASMLSAHVYPALYHEIFNEPERQAVLADLHHWLDQRWP